MTKQNFTQKSNGDTLSASEWNNLTSYINTAVDAINAGGSSTGTPSAVIDTTGVISVSGKGNVTVSSNKNVNVEPAWDNNTTGYAGNYGDVAIKPGDDIQFCSHHREPKKRDKIVVKNIDNSDNPVKMQVVAGEIDLAVGTKSNPKAATRKKDKTTGADTTDAMFKASDAKVMDLRILTGNVLDEDTSNERDERGYLKVRAQAIDLRCEKHGGIALQPKGYDNEGNMNKIKFEHGGGDGLEFGTFNAEKTSIFTNEYRFNKDGIWKMSVRETEASGKDIIDEKEGGLGNLTATGAYKYKKNNAANNTAKSFADIKTYEAADDFYDFIDTADAQTTTKDIINTAAAMNNDFIETSLSAKKNLKISASSTYKIIVFDGTSTGNELTFPVTDMDKSYSKEELKLILSGSTKLSDLIDTKLPFYISGQTGLYRLSGDITPKISVEAEEEVDLDAKYGDVVITSGDTIKCEAPEIRLNAINSDKSGGMVNFGATQDVVFLTNKLTASLNVESAATPTKIKLMLQNNYTESVFFDHSAGKFRIPVKHLYLDDSQTTELTPSNYANALPVFFADGTRVGADYTCFIATKSTSGNVTTTTIYKTGTKGSENVLKRNLGNPVAVYTYDSSNTSSNTSTLGVATSNTISNIEFEDYSFDGTGCETVGAEEFVSIKSIDLQDVIDIVAELKTMKQNNQGPWAA